MATLSFPAAEKPLCFPLQSAFFCINPQIMPYESADKNDKNTAVALMKYMAYKSFSRKGDAIVQMNYNAIDSAKEKSAVA